MMKQNPLREARKKAGLTQNQLSELIGVTQSTISQYESGKVSPGLNAAVKLAQALKISVETLINIKGGESNARDAKRN